jgi:hypothetical protein
MSAPQNAAPLTAEQRLEVSRAQCLQALRQPTWLLFAQRVCGKPAHAPGEKPSQSMAAELFGLCIKSFLGQLDNAHVSQGQDDHAQHQGPG